MEFIAERGRRVSVEELNTTKLLAHARKQAVQRKFDDMLIVDCDAHHYENENYDEILPFMENDVLRQLTIGGRAKGRRRHRAVPGRLTRTWAAASRAIRCGRRKRPIPAGMRDIQLGDRWMDAMSVDYSCLFPTGMLNIGLHPQKEMEVELCWAYNRWLTEKVLPETRRPHLLDAVPAVLRPRRGAAPGRDLRPPQGRHRLHGDDRAQSAGQRQRLHEGLSRHGGARAGARVPFRPELARAGVQAPATASSRCTRSASPSTTSSTAPTGSSTAWASAFRSCR